MTWQPSKQQLEDAALAAGKQLFTQGQFGGDREWQPHLPTTQGKADLLYLMLALPIGVFWHSDEVGDFVEVNIYIFDDWQVREARITNNDKHAALARAAIEVAAQVGAKMRLETT